MWRVHPSTAQAATHRLSVADLQRRASPDASNWAPNPCHTVWRASRYGVCKNRSTRNGGSADEACTQPAQLPSRSNQGAEEQEGGPSRKLEAGALESWAAGPIPRAPATLSGLICARIPAGTKDIVPAVQALGIDVEYAHFRKEGSPLKVVAAEVCLVAEGGRVVFHSYCHPGGSLVASSQFVGGVAPEKWQHAPSLKLVAAQLREATKGCLLVGHGLSKDLVALGIAHPKEMKRDTMSFRKFCGRGGQARKLEVLAQQLLGRKIQQGRHEAREDAVAALDLYLRFIACDPQLMAEEELMRHYLAGFLLNRSS